MAYQQKYVPIIKKKSFDPSPVAGKIPLYADGKSNPKVIGTNNYNEFWDEQIDRCINGYITGGLDIPGRQYYFLNFKVLSGVLGEMYPFYTDGDREVFLLVDYVKKRQKKGCIIPKTRRFGMSEIGATIISHGQRFIPVYRGAVIAGLDTYTLGLRKKYESGEAKIQEEFRLNILKDNDKMIQVGYEVKNPIGGFIEDGFGARISFETMYDDPKKLEGEYFHDVICEESGQFKLLSQTFESIKPALQFGGLSIGTFYIYGTGGQYS